MVTIHEVFDFVNSHLVDSMPDESKKEKKFIEDFLNSLISSNDVNSKRLLICIGIDIKTYKKIGITNNECSGICKTICDAIVGIENLTFSLKSFPPQITPAIKFCLSLKNMDLAIKLPLIKSKDEVCRYFRVVSFRNYIEWIVQKNLSFNSEFPLDIDLNEIDRYYYDFCNNSTFSGIKIGHLGSSTGWVFVGSAEELQKHKEENNINFLFDTLGFYINNINLSENYVWLEYPTNFDEIGFQPTSLIGDWGNVINERANVGNEFFLCYKKDDDWGRTFSISGEVVYAKERAHYQLTGNTVSDFIAYNLGSLTIMPNKSNEEMILNEALNRFSNS